MTAGGRSVSVSRVPSSLASPSSQRLPRRKLCARPARTLHGGSSVRMPQTSDYLWASRVGTSSARVTPLAPAPRSRPWSSSHWTTPHAPRRGDQGANPGGACPAHARLMLGIRVPLAQGCKASAHQQRRAPRLVPTRCRCSFVWAVWHTRLPNRLRPRAGVVAGAYLSLTIIPLNIAGCAAPCRQNSKQPPCPPFCAVELSSPASHPCAAVTREQHPGARMGGDAVHEQPP